MGTYDWKAAVNGSWTTAANWTPPGGPVATVVDVAPISNDAAEFRTGSKAAYRVTTGGLSDPTTVSGDHVNFVGFANGDDGYGGGMFVDHGAVVTLDKASYLDYEAHDGIGGGSIGVTDASLTDYGVMTSGDIGVGGHGVLNLVGPAATLSATDGGDIDAGGTMRVLAGAKFETMTLTVTINGRLLVSGTGSSVSLSPGVGSGSMQVTDHARANIHGPVGGTLRFSVSHGASLAFYSALGAGNVVTFGCGGSTLTLAADSAGEIVGFGKADALVVQGTVTRADWTAGSGGNGTLKLLDGGNVVETLAMRADYSRATFATTAEGSSKSRITLRAPPVAEMAAARGNATLGGHAAWPHVLAEMAAAETRHPGPGGRSPALAGAQPRPEPVATGSPFDFAHAPHDGATPSLVHAAT